MKTEPAHVTLARWQANGTLDTLGRLTNTRASIIVPRSGDRVSKGWIVEIGHGGMSVTVRFVDFDGVERGKNIATTALIAHNPSLFPPQ